MELPPDYEEALRMIRSAESSTDSGCHSSYLDHSPVNSSLPPSGSSPPQPCSSTGLGEPVTSPRLTEQDYLTLCQQDEQLASNTGGLERLSLTGEGNKMAVREDGPSRDYTARTERGAQRSGWTYSSERSNLKSSPEERMQTGSRYNPPSSRILWESIETEV